MSKKINPPALLGILGLICIVGIVTGKLGFMCFKSTLDIIFIIIGILFALLIFFLVYK